MTATTPNYLTPTTTPASTTAVRIAIPVADGRLHGHFGGTREFALVDVDTQALAVVARSTIAAPPHQPGLFPRWLREQGVRVVIAGGIGKRALDIFAVHGVAVLAGEVNARVEVLVAAYLAGLLTGSPVGCENHGHHHDHDHGKGHDHSHHEH